MNPKIEIKEINDTLDFLNANQGFTFTGRTVESVRHHVEQWHRALHRAKRMGNKTWDGFLLEDKIYERVQERFSNKMYDWSIKQIKTSKDLAEEGSKMHHCVYSYQSGCIMHQWSIWSLKKRGSGSGAEFERACTLELHDNGSIVQVRGFANRSPKPEEIEVIRQWAAENGLGVRTGRW